MIDKESVRNAALDECIRECERIAFDVTDTGIQTGAEICADSIESLKSRPSINVCNQCSGSGEFRKPLSVDPDEYVELGDCPDCRGTGVKPAQPSDSRTEFSDTEMLDWMLKNNGLVEIRGSQYYCGYGPYGTVLNGALAGSPREAIKAAMRAEREGK